ncbi:MAG TPA: hypothetical protein PLP50_16705 [Thermoanaerobaculia bacterium]|nr:hypothetical protein [Thermoanaerobaculia bacterium]HQN07557.1 hypothetical protein [Thermoanaerobaculia bacterium]HQP86406.1 hypothetical protein [Thermoanaerobaculia bacterium]
MAGDAAASPRSGSVGPEVRQAEEPLSELQVTDRGPFEVQGNSDRENASKLIAEDARITYPK